jgi:hypothetical protein
MNTYDTYHGERRTSARRLVTLFPLNLEAFRKVEQIRSRENLKQVSTGHDCDTTAPGRPRLTPWSSYESTNSGVIM